MSDAMDERKFLRIDAQMEGEAVTIAGIGNKVEVSEMELTCLVNFAEVGLFSMFASLDGETGEMAAADLEKHLDAIRKTFANDKADGLMRLQQSTAAILRSEKFQQFMVSE